MTAWSHFQVHGRLQMTSTFSLVPNISSFILFFFVGFTDKVFGLASNSFSSSYKETSFSGLEAPFKIILNVFWYEDLSEEHKLYLLIYDMIKFTCQKDGHTYLKHSYLENHWKMYQTPPSPEIFSWAKLHKYLTI